MDVNNWLLCLMSSTSSGYQNPKIVLFGVEKLQQTLHQLKPNYHLNLQTYSANPLCSSVYAAFMKQLFLLLSDRLQYTTLESKSKGDMPRLQRVRVTLAESIQVIDVFEA